MSTIATLNTRFVSDTKGFRSGIAEVERSTSGVGRVMSGVGNVASTMFTAGVGAAATFGAAVIKSGASYNVLYQTSSAAFKTILGSGEAANKMMGDLAKFAKTSPFPRQAFIEATQQMLSFGYAAEDVIPTLDAIQNAVAATGGKAQDINEIANVLSKVQSTGKFTAQTLNELGYRGIDAAKMIGQGMNMSANEVRDAITSKTLDAGQALRVLTEQMSATYAGAAEGVKNTWTGASDRIRSAMRDIGSAIVEPFIAKTGGGLALEWANKFADLLRAIEPLITPIVETVVQRLGPAFAKVSGTLDTLIERVKGFAGTSDAVQSLGGAFSSMLPVLAPVAALMLKVGGSNIGAMFGPLGGLIESVTGPFGKLTTVLLALVMATPEGRQGLGEIVQVLMTLVGPIMDVVRALGDSLRPIIAAVVPPIVDLFRVLAGVIRQVMPPIAQVVSTVGGALAQAFRSLSPVLSLVAQTIGGALRQALPPLATAFIAIAQAVAPVLPRLAQLAGQLITALLPILPTVAGLIAQLADVFTKLAPTISKLADVFVQLLEMGIKALLPVITELATMIGNTLAQILPQLVPVIVLLADAFMRVLQAVMPLIPPLLQLVVQVIQALIPIMPALVQLFMALVQAVVPLIPPMVTLVEMLLPPLVVLLKIVAGAVGIAAKVFADLIVVVVKIITFFVKLAGTIVGLLAGALNWLWGIGRDIVKGLMDGITKGAEAVWKFFSGLAGKIINLLLSAGEWLLDVGKKIIKGLLDGIKWYAENVLKRFYIDLPLMILGWIKDAGKWLWDTGKKIIEGLINGAKSMLETAKKAIEDVVKAPIDGAKKLLGIKSPSEVFIEIGEQIGEGLVYGMTAGAGAVALAGADLAAAAAGSAGGPATVAVGIAAPDTSGLDLLVASNETALGEVQSATGTFAAAQLTTWAGLSAGTQSIATALGAALIASFASTSAQLQTITAMFVAAVQAAWSSLAAFLRSTVANLAAALIATFQQLAATVMQITTVLSAGVRSTWSTMVSEVVFNAGWMRDQLTSIWRSMAHNVDQISREMARKFSEVMRAMVNAATSGGFDTGFQLDWTLRSFIPKITDVTRGYARSLRDALNPVLQGIGKGQIRLPFATGGRVPGTRGGGDTVPAMLTPGEYVIPASAAARLGPRLLEALREGVLPTPVRGYQYGGAIQEAANMLTSKFGLVVTSTYRPGDPGFHGKGQAVDLSGGAWGANGPMGRASDFINQSGMFRTLAEGIFNPKLSVKFGKQVAASFWGGATWGAHANHIHLAITGKGGDFGGFAVVDPIELPKVPEIKLGGEWFGGTAKKAMEHVRTIAEKWVADNTFTAALDGASAPSDVTGIQAMAKRMVEAKWNASQWAPFYQLASHENSTWDPRRTNPTSGALGIPQALPPSKLDSYGNRYDPAVQIRWMLDYIAGRPDYGTPARAWAMWQSRSPKWYGQGGLVSLAGGGIVSATGGGRHILAGEGGRDEAVVPLPRGWQRMFGSLADSTTTPRQGPAVNIEHYEVRESADHRRIFEMARFEERAGRI